MSYPKFYDSIEVIKLYDPLSDILNTFEDGKFSVSFKMLLNLLDIVVQL